MGDVDSLRLVKRLILAEIEDLKRKEEKMLDEIYVKKILKEMELKERLD